jgi:hypothetical protein
MWLPIFALLWYLTVVRAEKARKKRKEPQRTIENTFVSGRSPLEVKEEIHMWIDAEKNTIETERADFIKGKLGLQKNMFGKFSSLFYEISINA